MKRLPVTMRNWASLERSSSPKCGKYPVISRTLLVSPFKARFIPYAQLKPSQPVVPSPSLSKLMMPFNKHGFIITDLFLEWLDLRFCAEASPLQDIRYSLLKHTDRGRDTFRWHIRANLNGAILERKCGIFMDRFMARSAWRQLSALDLDMIICVRL